MGNWIRNKLFKYAKLDMSDYQIEKIILTRDGKVEEIVPGIFDTVEMDLVLKPHFRRVIKSDEMKKSGAKVVYRVEGD
jgi:hypothetical protein